MQPTRVRAGLGPGGFCGRQLSFTVAIALAVAALCTSAVGASGAPLGGLIVVPSPRGLNVIDPSSGEPTPLPVGGAGALPPGVARSASMRRLAVSVQRPQAGER